MFERDLIWKICLKEIWFERFVWQRDLIWKICFREICLTERLLSLFFSLLVSWGRLSQYRNRLNPLFHKKIKLFKVIWRRTSKKNLKTTCPSIVFCDFSSATSWSSWAIRSIFLILQHHGHGQIFNTFFLKLLLANLHLVAAIRFLSLFLSSL